MSINKWYDNFDWSAIILDVSSVLIIININTINCIIHILFTNLEDNSITYNKNYI